MNDTYNHSNTSITDKKILFLITQSKYGGAQKYVLQLAQRFKAGNEITIAIGEAQRQDVNFLEEARSFGVEPMVVSSLIRDISIIKAFEALLEIRKLLYKIRPDILHINSSMAGALGSCAAWLYNIDPLNKPIRVIYTAHGFVFNEPMSEWKKRFYIFIEKISAGWKNRIITVSEFDKQQALQHAISHERKLRVIHTGIDPHTISLLSRAEARAELGITNAAGPLIGTVASLYPTKGLTYLIQAAALLQTQQQAISFVIIGDGHEKNNLIKQIREGRLEATIHLPGTRPNAARLLRAFDLFVLPSVKEGLPYCLLEAGIARVPIIATQVGGVPEIIEDGKTGVLVPAQQPQSLADAIRTMLTSPPQAEKYANALYEKITREFTLSEMLGRTSGIYQEVTAPAPRKP